jgi:3-hydroxyisobutyrate dehydrogenase
VVAGQRGKVAVIGLGSMGYGIAASLARAGLVVTGYDARLELVARFAQEHGKGATSLMDAAIDADIVVSVVVNAAQTRAALFGADGAANSASPGVVLVSCATMSPNDAEALAAEAETRGFLYLDAPISGGPQRAAEGKLTVLASGSAAAFDMAAPALAGMAGTLHRLGDRAGIGAAFKMINQLLAGVHIAAACEAIVFAKSSTST